MALQLQQAEYGHLQEQELFGKKEPLPLVVHIPEPVVEVPFKVVIALLPQTVWFGPGITVPGAVTVTLTVVGALAQPATVAVTV